MRLGLVGELKGVCETGKDCCIFTGDERDARPFPRDGFGGVGGSTTVAGPSVVVMMRRVLCGKAAKAGWSGGKSEALEAGGTLKNCATIGSSTGSSAGAGVGIGAIGGTAGTAGGGEALDGTIARVRFISSSAADHS